MEDIEIEGEIQKESKHKKIANKFKNYNQDISD